MSPDLSQPTAPRFNPVLMALANVLFLAVPYLVLHLYARFFVVCLLLMVSEIFSIPWIQVLVFIFVVVDVYRQAKNMNEGQAMPPKKNSLHILGVVAFIFMVGFGLFVRAGGKDSLARSADSCSFLYPFNTALAVQCAENVETRGERADEDAVRSTALTDPTCEDFLTDPTLRVREPEGDKQYNSIFSGFCYFRKAVESGEVRYCQADTIQPATCVTKVAIQTKNISLCDSALGSKYQTRDCKEAYEAGRVERITNCDVVTDPARKVRCEQTFGSFLGGLL